MNIAELNKKFNPDKIDTVYLLHGDEFFLITEFIEKLKSVIVQGAMAEFNYTHKKAQETNGAKIVAEAKSMPMMANKRLVIIDDVHKLKVTDFEPLLTYIEKPVPETCLVLTGTKFDLRKGFFKKANAKKIVHKADSLREKELFDFVKGCSEKKKVAMGQDAMMAVVQAVGSDCAALDDAVERLGLFANEKKITVNDVENVVSNIRQHSIFELVDAMGNKNTSKVMRLFAELISNREEPIRINAMLTRQIRQLLNVKIYQYKKVESRNMAKMLGVPPFAVSKLVDQSRQFTSKALESALGRLSLADLELKSSKRTGERILEAALLDLSVY